MLGMDVRIAAPRELWPPADVRAPRRRAGAGQRRAGDGHRRLATAVDGAAFVYTDVWVSMGEATTEWDRRVPLLTPYRVTAR